MIIVIVYLGLFAVYMTMPKYLKLVSTMVNFFLPDPVPFIDEAAMVLGFMASTRD